MTPAVSKLVHQWLGHDETTASRLATADWMILALARTANLDHEALTGEFQRFNPNILCLLDSPQGVATMASALVAELGGEPADFTPTLH